MAVENEVKYSKSVPDVRSGGSIPIVEKKESVQQVGTPAIGEAFTEYGKADNFLSTVGNSIASTASNAIAAKLGGDYGQNPKGSLLPPMNEFDKTFKQNYTAQAHATLGLQANKLITDSNIELSNATSLTPEMIEKNQHQIAVGLQNIYKQAPDEVRPNLELQYGAIQQEQKTMLHNRLLKESHEQQHNTTMRFSSDNARDAYSLALSGNDKAAESAQTATEQINTINTKVNHGDPLVAEANVKAVRIARLTGRYIRLGLLAEKDGKLNEYMKDMASPPADVLPEDYEAVSHGVYNYFTNKQAMKNNYENVETQNMHNRIALAPGDISIADWAEYKTKVSPLKSSQMEFNLIQAMKEKHKDMSEQQNLIANWGSPEAQANAPDKLKNETYNKIVADTQAANPNMTHDEAQVQVAASSGARVPVFTEMLNNKMTSGSPAQIESGWQQIKALTDMEAGRALSGLSKEAEAIGIQYEHKKGTMPDADLAREVTDNITNIKGGIREQLDNSWNLILNRKGASGLSASQTLHGFALREVGLSKDSFGGIETFAVVYGNDIYQQLKSNFDVTRGDYNAALEMTKRYVKQNYGETRVNGDRQISDKPIERTLGYKDPGVVPHIQQDLLNQLGAEFEKHKTENEYWTTVPLEKTDNGFGRSTLREVYKPAEVIRHIKTPQGEKQFRYPISLLGRPGDTWDIRLNTPDGPRNISLVAAHQGIVSYKPDKEWINKSYMGRK